MSNFIQDLRYGIRTLVGNPGFTIVAVMSLAIGIGAVSSVYSMISATLLHPVPYEEGDRLVAVQDYHIPSGDTHSVSYPGFLDYQEQSESFEGMSVVSSGSYNLTGPEGPERAQAGFITSSFFPTLREDLIAGRNFYAEEDEIGKSNVVLLSHKLWKSRYNENPDVVGEAITLDEKSYTVVGVVHPDFRFLEVGDADIWVPAAEREYAESRGSGWLRCFGRLKDGVSYEQAQTELNVILAGMTEIYPEHYTEHELRVQRYGEDNVEELRVAFLILLGGVGFVLLIACVNVANLLLARVAGRTREITIRVAVGADRRRLLMQMLTENLVLATLGGGLGVLFSVWGINFIHSLLPEEMGTFYIEYFEFGMNIEVLLVTMSIALCTGFIFGILPAMQASKPDLNQSLKEGGAAGSGTKRNRLLSTLVVGEVALAIVLLISAGLMMQSFTNLQKVDPGFNPDNLMTIELSLPEATYSEGEQTSHFYERLEERIGGLGGVVSVGSTGLLPFSNSNSTTTIMIEGAPVPEPGHYSYASIRSITPNYAAAMEMPILKGRTFTAQDFNKEAPVVIVNESFVQRYWPGEDPVGKRFRRGGPDSDTPWMTVVGLLGDVRYQGFAEDHIPEFFLAHKESAWTSMHTVIRTKGDPEAITPAVRQVIAELDPNLPLVKAETMNSLIVESLWMNQFTTTLFGVLAVIALLLSVIGVYGVINYSVSQRTHEIGIRMALGAQVEDVRMLVVKQGLKLALLGVLIGLPIAFGLTKLMTSMLHGISPSDPLTFGGIAIVAVLIALVASYIPARKATKVDPMIALRYE